MIQPREISIFLCQPSLIGKYLLTSGSIRSLLDKKLLSSWFLALQLASQDKVCERRTPESWHFCFILVQARFTWSLVKWHFVSPEVWVVRECCLEKLKEWSLDWGEDFERSSKTKKILLLTKEIEQGSLNSDYLSATLNDLILQRSLYWNIYNVFVWWHLFILRV